MGFFNTAKIKAIDLLKQSYTYLNKQYGMNGSVFQPSSPTGQILSVVANISELIFLYLEHAASELNIMRAQTPESIHGLSRLTGHDPYRGCAASGMMRVAINPSSLNDFNGAWIRVLDGTSFTIEETGLQYFMKLGQEYIVLTNGSDPINVEFVQGIRNEQTFVADGKKLQSYNVNTSGMTDHDRVSVTVDGEKWKRVDSLYDMGYQEKCFMCKTSINMGLSIFFGNGDFGMIPESGKNIVVSYVNHLGTQGNATGSALNIRFITAGYDDNEETVDLNEMLSVSIERSPAMGAMYEPPELTRRLAPHQSKSFVLANPENYVAFLSKYGQFAFVDAYNTKDDVYVDDDNVVYLRILPNIRDKVTKQSDSVDYFTLPETEFTLDDSEKSGVLRVLDDSGWQLISTEVVIEDMNIKRYALVIVLKYFEKSDKNRIWSDIRSKLNTYFLNINRSDIIPKSDIVALVEGIDGVDSVNVYFISEENENAVRNGYYDETYEWINPDTHLHEKVTRRIDLEEGEDPGLGLDGFGDIVIKKDEVAIIRGGWNDRDGRVFKNDMAPDTLCGLTVLFTTATEDNLYNTTQQYNLNKILNGKM